MKLKQFIFALVAMLSFSFSAFAQTVTTAEALKAALESTTGSEVVLGGDIALPAQITVPKKTAHTLDLNGHHITGGIYVYGTLTINDNVGTGSITANTYVLNGAGGSRIILNGGRIYRGSSWSVYTTGVFVVNGGEVENTIRVAGSGSIQLKGGTVESLQVTSGNLSITDDAVVNGNLNIEKGAKGVNIADGTINGDITIANEATDKVTVSGGTFKDADAIKDYLPGGSTLLEKPDGTYEIVAGLLKIGETYYPTLAAALEAANDGDTVELLSQEGAAPIAMNGSLYGKSVTITGTATVDWNKGWLFVARGGAGNATLTFDNANLTSASNSASYGIHVSGREKGTADKYDGTVVIKNSAIELDYLINKGAMTLDNSTLTVKNGFDLNGRPAHETENGEDANATLALTNNSKLVVNNHNGMGIGREGKGELTVDASSTFEHTQDFLVCAKGTMDVKGTLVSNGTKLTNNGEVKFTATKLTAATIEGTGTTRFYNEVNFYGANSITTSGINGTPFHLVVNEGANLFITRFVLGYDRNITVNGTIADASAFNPEGQTPSLKFNSTSGVSVGGTGTGNLQVKNAYVELDNSSWKNAQGTYDWDFVNSYVSATSFTNATGADAATWDVTFDNSVLAAKNYIKNGKNVTYNFTNNSRGTTGSLRIDGVLNIDATSSVVTTSQQNNKVGAVDEHGGINGTVNVAGNLTIGSNAKTQLEVLGGTVNVKEGATLALGNHTLTLDATSAMQSAGNISGAITAANGANVAISGGTYTQNVDEWCAEGFMTQQNADGSFGIAKAVAKVGDKKYATLEEAFKAATSGCTIEIVSDVTVDYAWDARYTGGKFTVPVTIDGNGKTIKFTASVNDNNNQAPFRFEADATVKNLTIDMSEVTDNRFRAISSKGNLTVDNSKFIGKDESLNCRAIIFGEGAGANVGNLAVAITNSEFINWKRGITDNENAQDVKTVTITGNKLTDAGVGVSAKEKVTFTGNTVSGAYVNIKSYTAGNKLAVTATGNTLEANTDAAYNVIDAGGVVNAEGFNIVAKGNNFNGYTSTDAIWGEVWGNAKESFVIKVLDANGNVMGTTSLNNIGGIIDGDVNVSWNLKFNAAANTDEYWTMAWTTAPSISNMPAKVELWVDGVKVSGGPVVLNGPDDLNKIVAAATDADGKIISCHTSVDAAAATNATNIALLRETTEEIILPVGTILNKNGFTAANVKTAVAVIGTQKFASLQAAVNAVKDGETITLVDNVAENVTVSQAPNVKFTIDGGAEKTTMTGVITIDGKSEAYASAGVTIKNLKFDAANIAVDACINLSDGTTATRYTNNVTVENCTFTGGNKVKAAIKSYQGGDKNLTVTGCAVDNTMHSLIQAANIAGVVVDGCTVESKNGINLNSSSDVEIKNSTIDVNGYAVRAGVSGGTSGKIELANNTLKTNGTEDAVIVIRGTASEQIDLAMSQNVVSGATHISGTTNKTKVSADANYWDGATAPVTSGTEVAVNSYYVDDALQQLVRIEKGSIYAYVYADRIFGDVTTNAAESLVVEIIGADGNVIGTSTLEKPEHRDGTLKTLTWRINFGADDSGSWAMQWNEGAPSINNIPTKVRVMVDGKAMAEAAIKYTANGDGQSPVVAAKNAADGKFSFVVAEGKFNLDTAAETLNAAIAAGDNVAILAAGTYKVPTGKDLTITGAVEGVEFANIGAHNMGGANVTFNNVTFTYAENSTYKGLQHSGNLVYNNCTFNGQVFLYGQSETFNKCTFNTTDAANYNVWTYGAKNVAFNECTFNSAGKSVLIYSESASVTNNVTVTKSQFNATQAVEGKAAIEMDSSLSGAVSLTIDGETTATGFAAGNVSGNSLWNNKKGNSTDANNDITVVVNGETVLAPLTFVAKIGDNGYTALADAFAAVNNNETITLATDLAIDSETYTIADGKNVTLDMNGKKITVTDNKTSNYELFYIYGGMTVIGNGTIELTATNDRDWNASSSIFHNRGGVLTIANGTFNHLGGTDMAYVVDNSGNWYGDATTNINGGELSSTYIAIRNRMEQNSHGASGKAILNVTAGTISGTSRAIWAQAASTSETAPATGEINISGGTINGLIDTPRSTGAKSMTTVTDGTVAAFKGEVGELKVVAPGKITGEVTILTAAGEVVDYMVNTDGVYVDKGAVINSGTWGGIDWSLTNDGTLTIAATAGEPVPDKNAPTKRTYEVGEWRETVIYNKNGGAIDIGGAPYDMKAVKHLIIKEGVTMIGSFTCQFPNLTGEVVIPSTVKYIGQEAFHKTPITKLTFAAGGTEPLCIANGAFKKTLIEEVSFPGDREYIHIHHWAFGGSSKLKTAYIPANVTKSWGGEHVDYFDNFNSQSNVTWAEYGSIFTGCTKMETITFENKEVRDLFFAKNRQSTAEDYIVAAAGLVAYNTFDKALANIENGSDLLLVKDATLKETLTIPADWTFAINLNGRTLSQSKACTASYEMINNKGNLTITGNGKISFKDTSAGDPNFNWGSYTVRNEGNLVVENGTIEHTGAQAFGTHCIMAIFQYCGSTTIKGGKISTPNYRSVRLWKGDMTIDGGTFDGQVWVQAVDESAKLTINGGTFAPSAKGDASSVFVENSDHDVKLAVANGTFNGKVGCSDATKLAGAIEGGKFNEVAKNATNPALLADGFIFNDELVDGYYAVVEGLAGEGTVENPYLISTAKQLEVFRSKVNSGDTKYNAPGVWVALGADIDLEGAEWNEGIGDGHNYSFDGNFDGKNYTIKNLNIKPYADESGYLCGGLFGYIYGSVTIKNLVIENANVEYTGEGESHNVGVLAGFAYKCNGAVIDNVTVKGNIKVNAPNTYGVGAIVGYTHTNAPAITNCKVLANNDSYIKGHRFVGGIAGYSYTGATIKECTVKNIAITATDRGAAGIAGCALAGEITKCTVENVTLNATANVAYVVGELGGNVVNVAEHTAPQPWVGGSWSTGEVFIATIGNKYYTSIPAAIEAAQAGETVKLIADIELAESVTVPAGKEIVLDLNGKTITGTDNATGSFGLITNKGNLTINGEGAITLVATNDRDWNAYSSVISNTVGGKLTVNGGTIEHLGGTDMAYAIDNLTNGKGTYAETIINGGAVKSTYRAVRQFLNGTEAQNILTVNGGTIEGTNKSIWMQDPSKNSNTGKLTVAADAQLTGDVYLSVTAGSTEWPVEVAVAAAALQGESKVLDNGNVPAGYDLALVNGAYGVYTGVAKIGTAYYDTLKDAVAAAQASETITLLADIEATEVILLGKSLTINGNGHKVTSNATRVFRVTTSDTKVTLNDVNMVSRTVMVYPNDIRGISIDAGLQNVELTLNNCSVDFTDATACDWAYAVNVSGNGTGHTVTVNGGTYEGANVINVHGANNTVTVKDATLTSLYPNNDTYYGACIWVLQNQNTSVEATGNTFNGDNAYAFNLGNGNPLTESDNIDNTKYVLAKIGDVYYTSIQDAIEAAQDGETVRLIQNVKMDTKGAMANCDGYPTFVCVEGKAVTLDLNGKNITVNAYAEDLTGTMLLGVFSTDNGGKLTLADSKGTATVTLNANDAKVYSFLCNYEPGCQIKVEGGTYVADKVSDSMIYSGADAGENEGVTVNGGNFTLGNVGEGTNGKPWIFNVLRGNEGNVVVNGGTFNADVNHQFWANEVFVPETKALKDNGDGTWTVVDATAYTMELSTSTGATERKVGYATLHDAIAAVKENKTITLVKDITYTKENGSISGEYVDGFVYTGDKSFTLDFAGKTITENGDINDYLVYLKNTGEKDNVVTFMNGTIAINGESTNTAWAAITVGSSSATHKTTLNLNGMKVVNGNPNDANNQVIRSRNGAVVNLNDGTVVTSNGTSYGVVAETTATVNINDGAKVVHTNSKTTGGNLVYTAVSGNGTINVYDGAEIVSDNYGIHNMTSGNAVINIYGGTIEAVVAVKASTNGGANQSATVTIEGGNFEGALENYTDAATIVVKGGTFDAAVDTKYVATGYICKDNGDGTFGVVVDPKHGMVAQIIRNDYYAENQYFATINEAVQAAVTGETVTLIADVETSAAKLATIGKENYAVLVAVKEKDITLNLNGKSVTVTPTSEELANAEGQMLMSVFGMDTNGKLTLTGNGSVKVNANGANVYSLVAAYGEGSAVVIENGNYEADKVMSSGSLIYSHELITVMDGTFNLGNIATGANGSPWIFNTIGQNYTGVKVVGGTYPTDINHQFWANEVLVPEAYALKNNGDGTWTVVDAVAYTNEKATSRGASWRHVGYASLEDAIAATGKYNCQNNTVTMIKDITLEPITVANGVKVAIDLNGKTISGTDNSTATYCLITNKGDLTINGTGAITLTANNERGWGARSAVISNEVGGKLTVNGGTIEHFGGTSMAYAIDNLTNGKGTYAETEINGGEIKSTYRPIRMFLNGVEAQNILTVNAGTIESTGGNRAAIWMQTAGDVAHSGTLYVGADAVIKNNVYLDADNLKNVREYPVEAYIAKAALAEGMTVLADAIPAEAAALVEYDTFWQVEQKNLAELTIEDACEEYINKIQKNVGVLTYERYFDDTEWQTIVLPFNVPVANLMDQFEVAYIYNASYKGKQAIIDYVVIEDSEFVLAANYPYMIRAKEAGWNNIVVENAKLMPTEAEILDCSSIFEKFSFIGNYATVDADDLDETMGYFSLNGTWSKMDVVNPFRFYMQIKLRNGAAFEYPTEAQPIRMRSVNANGETTGIDGVDAEQAGDFIFDLHGRRVLETEKGGIYIKNGKKFIAQ